jgi:hypothetical protein
MLPSASSRRRSAPGGGFFGFTKRPLLWILVIGAALWFLGTTAMFSRSFQSEEREVHNKELDGVKELQESLRDIQQTLARTEDRVEDLSAELRRSQGSSEGGAGAHSPLAKKTAPRAPERYAGLSKAEPGSDGAAARRPTKVLRTNSTAIPPEDRGVPGAEEELRRGSRRDHSPWFDGVVDWAAERPDLASRFGLTSGPPSDRVELLLWSGAPNFANFGAKNRNEKGEMVLKVPNYLGHEMVKKCDIECVFHSNRSRVPVVDGVIIEAPACTFFLSSLHAALTLLTRAPLHLFRRRLQCHSGSYCESSAATSTAAAIPIQRKLWL